MTHSKVDKLLYRFSFASLVIITVSLVWILGMLVAPYDVLEVHNEPFPITQDGPFHPGDVVPYYVELCKHTDAYASIRYEFVGPTVTLASYEIPSYVTPKGCVEFTSYAATLPDGIPPGEYHINIHVSYRVNPVRDIDYVFQTEKFMVEAPND